MAFWLFFKYESVKPKFKQLKFTWLLGEFCCEEHVDEVTLNIPTAFDYERARAFTLPFASHRVVLKCHMNSCIFDRNS